MKNYDICTNLHNYRFNKDRESVISRAKNLDIVQISSGVDDESIEWNIKNCPRLNIPFTAGVHPHYSNTYSDKIEKLIIKAFENPLCVMGGETGLDYYRKLSSVEVQKKVFVRQIELSIEHKKPLLLHDRDAHEDFLKILSGYKNLNAVVHCCTSPVEVVKEYVSMGLYVGFTGWITDPRRSSKTNASLKVVPLNKLLIETDAPFLTPFSEGKKVSERNESSNLFYVSEFIAEYLDMEHDELKEQVSKNTEKFLNIK